MTTLSAQPDPVATAADEASATRHVRLAASRRWPLPDLGELWHYRELLVTLAARDLKLRYKQTALGVIWAIFPPLVAAAIFTYIRGFLQLATPGNAPSILFVLAGFVGFTVFRDTLDRSGQSLLANQHLVSKIYFPRLLLPLAATLSVLFDHVIMLGLVVVVWLACGLIYANNADVVTPMPGLHLLMWPVVTLLSVMLASGCGMIVAALSSHYRDFKHVVPVALQLLLYASPVFYDLSLPLERSENGWIILLNPLSGPARGLPMVADGHRHGALAGVLRVGRRGGAGVRRSGRSCSARSKEGWPMSSDNPHDLAIRCQGVGKRYRLGATASESLGGFVKARLNDPLGQACGRQLILGRQRRRSSTSNEAKSSA